MVRGPQPKHPDNRQRRNKPTLAVVTDPSPEQPTPDPPDGLLPASVAAWDQFWSSDVARSVSVEDLATLTRLFYLRDEWERVRILVASSGPLIKGSKGQLVENPVSKRMDRLAGQITQLEDRFGMNPMARARLAVSLGEFHRTMDDLARELRETSANPDSDPLQIVDVQDAEA